MSWQVVMSNSSYECEWRDGDAPVRRPLQHHAPGMAVRRAAAHGAMSPSTLGCRAHSARGGTSRHFT